MLCTLHREFELKGAEYPSHLKSRIPYFLALGTDCPLQKFQELTQTNVKWPSKRQHSEDDEVKGAIQYIPTFKKVKNA